MTEPTLAGAPPAERAAAWARLAGTSAAAGHRDRALVAARTALALLDRLDAAEAELEAARTSVRDLTGPDVVPLHVDLAAGEHDGPDARAEARAVWVGAPEEPVLAMLGWVERDGALDVVRVVVPGTRRGRSAFDLLVRALPTSVPVTVRLPLRDPGVRKVCERRGFTLVEDSLTGGGHVGGSLRLHRPAG